MIFPLGTSCKVRTSIHRYTNAMAGTIDDGLIAHDMHHGTMETNMFDWVFTDFPSILYFLKNIDVPIVEGDFHDMHFEHLGKRFVGHNKITFESLHDINESESYEEGMPQFLEKYNRRLCRLKKTILNEDKLDFVHLVDYTRNFNNNINPLQIQEFVECIRKINPKCDFNLHVLIPPSVCRIENRVFEYDYSKLEALKIYPNIFVHYLKDDTTIPPDNYEHYSWRWDDVYNTITYLRLHCK